MKQKVETFKIVCDCCGQVFQDGDDFVCFIDDQDGTLIEGEALESEWHKTANGKHYCSDCWQWDNDDNIATMDGHVYDSETLKEISL